MFPISDDERDARGDALVAAIARTLRLEVVQSLLVGNDAACFTTQQYADAYRQQSDDLFQVSGLALTAERARTHLESLKDVIVEVSPDVWADRFVYENRPQQEVEK